MSQSDTNAMPPTPKRQKQSAASLPMSWQCQHCYFVNLHSSSTRCRSCDIRSAATSLIQVVSEPHQPPHVQHSTTHIINQLDLSDSEDEGGEQDVQINADHQISFQNANQNANNPANSSLLVGALPPGILSSILSFVFEPCNTSTLSLVSHIWYGLVHADILWETALGQAMQRDKCLINGKRRGTYMIVDLSCSAAVFRARTQNNKDEKFNNNRWTCSTCGLLQGGTGSDSCEFCGGDRVTSETAGRRRSLSSTVKSQTSIVTTIADRRRSFEKTFEKHVKRLGPCMQLLLTYHPNIDTNVQPAEEDDLGKHIHPRFTAIFHTKVINTQHILSDRFGHLSRGWAWVRRALARLFVLGTLTELPEVGMVDTSEEPQEIGVVGTLAKPPEVDVDNQAEEKAIGVVRSVIVKLLRQDPAGARHSLRVELALYAEAIRRDLVAAVPMKVVELYPDFVDEQRHVGQAHHRQQQQHGQQLQEHERVQHNDCRASYPLQHVEEPTLNREQRDQQQEQQLQQQEHRRVEQACRLSPTVHESRRFLSLLTEAWESYSTWSSLVSALYEPVLESELGEALMGLWRRRTVYAVTARMFRLHVILSPALLPALNASLMCLTLARDTDLDMARTALDIVDLVFERGLAGSTLHDAMRPLAQYGVKLSQIGNHDVGIVQEVLRMGHELREQCGDDKERDESADGAYDCDMCDAWADRHISATGHDIVKKFDNVKKGRPHWGGGGKQVGACGSCASSCDADGMQVQLVPQCKQLRRALLVLPQLFVHVYGQT